MCVCVCVCVCVYIYIYIGGQTTIQNTVENHLCIVNVLGHWRWRIEFWYTVVALKVEYSGPSRNSQKLQLQYLCIVHVQGR